MNLIKLFLRGFLLIIIVSISPLIVIMGYGMCNNTFKEIVVFVFDFIKDFAKGDFI